MAFVARLRSFNTQLLGSHLLVTVLTIISMLLLVIIVITFRPNSLILVQLRDEAEHSVADWQRGASAEELAARPLTGRGTWIVIVTADEVVRFARGATPCQVGVALAARIFGTDPSTARGGRGSRSRSCQRTIRSPPRNGGPPASIS